MDEAESYLYRRKESHSQFAKTNQMRTQRIKAIKTVSPMVKTFAFGDKKCTEARPGQFLMLWIPGVDEIPLSILDARRKEGVVSVAVKRVGEATKALHNMKLGEIIGLRGPFGNSFSIREGRNLLVGGGTGIAPLLFLARKLVPVTKKIIVVLGAKTKDELLFFYDFRDIFRGTGNEVLAVTEDGSCGVEGQCTSPLEDLLVKEKFDFIYTCGPEQMMLRVFGLAEKHGLLMEASLERLMRCAMGLCGSCVIGTYRVCRDGAIFNSKQLREVEAEFGISRRDLVGKTVPI